MNDNIKPDKNLDNGLNVVEIQTRLLQMYPIGLVPRNKIEIATGEILNSKTMSSLDSLNTGIKGGIKIGKKMCYPIDEIIKYIQSKIKQAA